MPICLPQQCLALVYGLPPPRDPLFRESPGWWVMLQGVGHRHRACPATLHVTFFVPEGIFLSFLCSFFLSFFGPLQGTIFVPQSVSFVLFFVLFLLPFSGPPR